MTEETTLAALRLNVKLCCFCNKPFKPWMDSGVLNDEACQMCDAEYQEGMEFDRDNFGDN